MLSQSSAIVQGILNMVQNAGIVRMEHFEHEDLLVIDCLKPAVDLLNQFCRADADINKSL